MNDFKMMTFIDNGACGLLLRLQDMFADYKFRSLKEQKSFLLGALDFLLKDHESRRAFMQDPGTTISCAWDEKKKPIMFVLHESGITHNTIRETMMRKYPEDFSKWISSAKGAQQQ